MGTLSVLSYNDNGEKCSKDEVEDLSDIITEADADVIFLSEDFDDISQDLDSCLRVHYPYTTYSCTQYNRGHHFYSKFPLSNFERVLQADYPFSQVFFCDINALGKKIRVFGVHFASNNYNANNDYVRPEHIDSYAGLCMYLDDIRLASVQRCHEADSVVRYMSQMNVPTIIMGDMNNVCGSEPLNILERAGLQDAWWYCGFGYGATIHHPLPYRIDHIMYSNHFKLIDVEVIDSHGLSDHDAVFAEFVLKEK